MNIDMSHRRKIQDIVIDFSVYHEDVSEDINPYLVSFIDDDGKDIILSVCDKTPEGLRDGLSEIKDRFNAVITCNTRVNFLCPKELLDNKNMVVGIRASCLVDDIRKEGFQAMPVGVKTNKFLFTTYESVLDELVHRACYEHDELPWSRDNNLPYSKFQYYKEDNAYSFAFASNPNGYKYDSFIEY